MAINQVEVHIPTEVHLDFLGQTIQIHWGYHALLMVGIWLVLVPICIITIRFGKPRPTLDINARSLLQVKVKEVDDADDIFTKLMGELVEPRRAFIQDNALTASVDV